LSATEEEIATDYWAHRYYENPKEIDEVVSDDPDFDMEEILRKAEAGEWEDI
jgi:hypothetical protein